MTPIIGGVEFSGDWYQVWRANVYSRTATRILVRLGEFPAVHLSQLDKKARKFPWQEHLKAQHPVRVEVVSRKSKIYHARAAAERIENAIVYSVGNRISQDADICIKVRIEKNLVKISIDVLVRAFIKEATSLPPAKLQCAKRWQQHFYGCANLTLHSP